MHSFVLVVIAALCAGALAETRSKAIRTQNVNLDAIEGDNIREFGGSIATVLQGMTNSGNMVNLTLNSDGTLPISVTTAGDLGALEQYTNGTETLLKVFSYGIDSDGVIHALRTGSTGVLDVTVSSLPTATVDTVGTITNPVTVGSITADVSVDTVGTITNPVTVGSITADVSVDTVGSITSTVTVGGSEGDIEQLNVGSANYLKSASYGVDRNGDMQRLQTDPSGAVFTMPTDVTEALSLTDISTVIIGGHADSVPADTVSLAWTLNAPPTASNIWFQSNEAFQVTVHSTSADDTNDSGTGARVVYIEGINATGVLVSETIVLNGTTASQESTNAYIRIHRATVFLTGTYHGTNAGDIYINSTAVGQATVGIISQGENYYSPSHYMVPTGKAAFIRSVYGSGYCHTATCDDRVILRLKRARSAIEQAASYSSAPFVLLEELIHNERYKFDFGGLLGPFTAGDDLWVEVKNTNTESGELYDFNAYFSLILVDASL